MGHNKDAAYTVTDFVGQLDIRRLGCKPLKVEWLTAALLITKGSDVD
jgi:hypothetical protein